MLLQANRTATMRTSDGERQRVADFLRDACADGRLSPDELDARLDDLWGGRTVDDLRRLVWDLPGGEGVLPRLGARPRPMPARPVRRRSMRAVAVALGLALLVAGAVLALLPDFLAFALVGVVVGLTMLSVLLAIALAPVALFALAFAKLAEWLFRGRLPGPPWAPGPPRRRLLP
jgi:hypothetical protein